MALLRLHFAVGLHSVWLDGFTLCHDGGNTHSDTDTHRHCVVRSREPVTANDTLQLEVNASEQRASAALSENDGLISDDI